MIQEGYKSQSLDSQIDLRYIFRTLKKNAVFILMCVCLTGMFSYVILDHSLKDTYTVSVNLCVIPRDNTSEKLAETNIENALERSVNVLNSDTMRDQIMKASGSSRVKGNLSASVVADTNIIRMSASTEERTEESAGDARRYGDWRYSTDNQRILRSYH